MTDITFKEFNAYRRYLISPSWQERRAAAIERSNGLCERCGQRPATQVHHVSYRRLFNERPTDLMAVCDPCHVEIHDLPPANDNQMEFDFEERKPPPGSEMKRLG